MNEFKLKNRKIGPAHEPLVIAEIGINHEGDIKKAMLMVDAAAESGCECVKFQSHVIEDEMIPNNVIPGMRKSRFGILWRVVRSPLRKRKR